MPASEWERGKLIDMMPSSTGRRVVLNTCTILLCFAVGHNVVRREDAKRKENRKEIDPVLPHIPSPTSKQSHMMCVDFPKVDAT
jgi:hypothetical protein